jgi:galactonate dehydratase
MRIAKIEDLHCNAGWRDFSFLKITTDEGLVGWCKPGLADRWFLVPAVFHLMTKT